MRRARERGMFDKAMHAHGSRSRGGFEARNFAASGLYLQNNARIGRWHANLRVLPIPARWVHQFAFFIVERRLQRFVADGVGHGASFMLRTFFGRQSSRRERKRGEPPRSGRSERS